MQMLHATVRAPKDKNRSLTASFVRWWRRTLQTTQLYGNLIRRHGIIQSLRFICSSKSQIKQDIFALSELKSLSGGFFIEFGATNGINRSNTWMMEKVLHWEGILAEPARCWHHDLKINRGCKIDNRCVWSKSGDRLSFDEVVDPELSTLNSFSEDDFHRDKRRLNTSYNVDTVSLNDLLEQHAAPAVIEFLSIDTEGSEHAILAALDFNKFQFKVIVCEHNYAPIREKIWHLMTSKGYVQKYPELSRFDDWYVQNS